MRATTPWLIELPLFYDMIYSKSHSAYGGIAVPSPLSRVSAMLYNKSNGAPGLSMSQMNPARHFTL